MKDVTEPDIIAALNSGIDFLKSESKKENRDLTDFEKSLINGSESTLKKIQLSSYFFKRIQELVQKNFLEESIILTVTFFEIEMRDMVKNNKDIWFFLPKSTFFEITSEQKGSIRKKIKKYLEKRSLYDQYLKNFHLYQDIVSTPEISALYDTLFDDEKDFEKINFQNIDDNYGVKEIFKLLYNIDIKDHFDTDQKKSHQRWNSLEKLIKERHRIIHSGEKTTLKPEEIIEVLQSIDSLNSKIRQKFLGFLFTMTKKEYLALCNELKLPKEITEKFQ